MRATDARWGRAGSARADVSTASKTAERVAGRLAVGLLKRVGTPVGDNDL
jgi:hypothetical protein